MGRALRAFEQAARGTPDDESSALAIPGVATGTAFMTVVRPIFRTYPENEDTDSDADKSNRQSRYKIREPMRKPMPEHRAAGGGSSNSPNVRT